MQQMRLILLAGFIVDDADNAATTDGVGCTLLITETSTDGDPSIVKLYSTRMMMLMTVYDATD